MLDFALNAILAPDDAQFVQIFWTMIYILYLWPTARILRRAGYSWMWTPIIFAPLLNIVAVWRFCFRPWPIDRLRDAHKGPELPPLPKGL